MSHVQHQYSCRWPPYGNSCAAVVNEEMEAEFEGFRAITLWAEPVLSHVVRAVSVLLVSFFLIYIVFSLDFLCLTFHLSTIPLVGTTNVSA